MFMEGPWEATVEAAAAAFNTGTSGGENDANWSKSCILVSKPGILMSKSGSFV